MKIDEVLCCFCELPLPYVQAVQMVVHVPGDDGYSWQLASDLDRDGMGFELKHPERGIVAEAFHFDGTGQEVFSTFGELSLDLADAQRFIDRARSAIRPMSESG